MHNSHLSEDPARRAKSINVALESRDALGPSLRRLANSDAIAITFPRDALRRVAVWPELSRRGVYMLIAPDTGDRALRIYVGTAQCCITRLKRHERDRLYPRYLQIAVMVSTDDQLREDVARHVEQRLVEALIATGLVEVENKPPAYPALPPDVRIVAERFFRDCLLLLGPVEPMTAMVCNSMLKHERRNTFLKDGPSKPTEVLGSNILYELRHDNCHAFAIKSEDRTMRVLAGAKIAGDVHYSLPLRGRALRQRLIDAGTLMPGPQPGSLILLQDVDVFSHRGAADLVRGRKTNGYHSWKLANLTPITPPR